MSGRYHRAAQGWKKEHPRVGGRVASLPFIQWMSDRTVVTSIIYKSYMAQKLACQKLWPKDVTPWLIPTALPRGTLGFMSREGREISIEG